MCQTVLKNAIGYALIIVIVLVIIAYNTRFSNARLIKLAKDQYLQHHPNRVIDDVIIIDKTPSYISIDIKSHLKDTLDDIVKDDIHYSTDHLIYRLNTVCSFGDTQCIQH